MKYLTFQKELSGKWYIILPEWQGCKDDLEMVLGADTMLDIISQGEYEVELCISTRSIEHDYVLLVDHEDGGGMWYNLKSDIFEFPVWLCHVTKFLFDKFPNKIYIKNAN